MTSKIKVRAGVAAVTLAAAAAFIIPWEGNSTKPYLDVGGVPTVCAGVIKGVNLSKLYTEQECSEMNASEIQAHAEKVLACVTRPVSQDEKIAIISIGYNAGTSAICNSTLVSKLNAGEPYCDEYLRWNKVKKKEVRGLTNRRKAERALCVRASNG